MIRARQPPRGGSTNNPSRFGDQPIAVVLRLGGRFWSSSKPQAATAQSVAVLAAWVDEAASASASWRCSVTERPRRVADGLVRHEQTVRHTLLEVPNHCGFVSGDRDRQHLAISGPELDNVSAVIFRTEDHNPVLARHFRPLLAGESICTPARSAKTEQRPRRTPHALPTCNQTLDRAGG